MITFVAYSAALYLLYLVIKDDDNWPDGAPTA